MGVYVAGTIVGLITIVQLVPGRWGTITTVAGAAGNFHVFDFSSDLFQTYTLVWFDWRRIFHHSERRHHQLIVQRLLAAKSERESKYALLFSGVAIFFQFSLFLLLGRCCSCLQALPSGDCFRSTETIFPTFIVTEMPSGVRGILIEDLGSRNVESECRANALSLTTIVDFYLRLDHSELGPPHSSFPRIPDRLGMRSVWFRIAGETQRPRFGGRTFYCGGRLWRAVRRIFVGSAHPVGERTGRNRRHGLGFALNLYLWRFPGSHSPGTSFWFGGDVFGRIRSQPGCRKRNHPR